MISKDECMQKYNEFKSKHGRIPKIKEFNEFAGLPRRHLASIFDGRDAYTKLQMACGDNPTRLNVERTPTQTIMKQYGDLALKTIEDFGELPNTSDWIGAGYRPTVEALAKRPHFIKWSEFPHTFLEWTESEGINGYERVNEHVELSRIESTRKAEKRDVEFEAVIQEIRRWTPGRRRNTEESYKVELRGHLKSLKFKLEEEVGDSHQDLRINQRITIEIKKAPDQSEYDRLFGQLARHLQHQLLVIALIFDAPSNDKFDNFTLLVDEYLNRNEKTVEVIKK